MSKASAYFRVGSVNTRHDVKQLKRELDTIRGVLSVSVNEKTERIAVDFDTTGTCQRQIEKRIEALGYAVMEATLDDHIM